MKTISVMCPIQPVDLATAVHYARVASNIESARLWCGQSLNIETHHVFAALSGMGFDLSFASGVTLMPLRHPATAAIGARSVAKLSGNPYLAGIGPASSSMQRAALGAPYQSPLTATRRYITAMRGLLEVGNSGPSWGNGVEVMPFEAPQVHLGLGVLRPKMAGLAGEVADAAITWLTPPGYVSSVLLPAVEKAAANASRKPPRIVTNVHCAVARRGRDLDQVAFAASSAHLSSPHYTDMLNRAGVSVHRADPHAGAHELVREGVLAAGSPREIAARLHDYFQAGVSEVVVNVAGVHLTSGPGAALRDLTAILSACEEEIA